MKKLVLKLFLIILVSSIGISILPHTAKAATFNPSNIIDDVVWENAGSMSAAQIDSWLNSNFPSSCIRPSSGFRTPLPLGWSSGDNQYKYGSNVTAGTAIKAVANLYKLNPHVMLATLQKEQSIVSGTAGCYNEPNPNWPFSSTPQNGKTFNCQIGGSTTTCTYACTHSGGCMNIAVGYNCPGYCKASSEGFSKQITLGGWVLRFAQQRAYGILTGYQGYEAGDENLTYTGPMVKGSRKRCAGCQTVSYDGNYTTSNGVNLKIVNGSTAALYNFTPFTTGNSSFNTIFRNWFGSPFAIYSWQLVSQTIYTDSSRTKSLGWGATLTPGQTAYVVIIAANNGDVPWENSGDNPVDLGTNRPGDRNSAFCTAEWLSCRRPARLQEAVVNPGEWGTFTFPIKAPTTTGSYNEYFNLVAEGITWFKDIGQSLQLKVEPLRYSWKQVSQAVYTDSNMGTMLGWGATLTPGQSAFVKLIVSNTSNFTWTRSGSTAVWLGTAIPNDRSSPFCTGAWSSCNRPALMEQTSVPPGSWASFSFPVTAPNSTGTYAEHFNLVSSKWFKDIGQHVVFKVAPKIFSWQPAGQAVYTDASKSTLLGWGATLNTSQNAYALVAAKNTSNFTWTNTGVNKVNLGTWSPADRTSLFYNAGWARTTRPATLTQASVAPGQTGTFEFPITAPGSTGSFNEHFNLVVDGRAWFGNPGQFFQFTVQ